VTVSTDDMLAAARRELNMRKRVYPRWVEAGRITQVKADHEIACMESIVQVLENRKAAQEPSLL
jgi:hypothetical protein